ncbi:Regulator of nonsense transcripts 1 [Hypsizygus marmoreus]|uniref:Regulator of nonsense transcripts 1 n=1 Tax=Hypsizygus marmoreus TaxID=39966 RepID=A0A369K2T1_HYPMA|nr:Regulator of nonsense transcripts 1 [Hypsizygus marmoreus]
MPPATDTRPRNVMQTFIAGDYSLVKISTTIVQESDINSDTFLVFDHARPIGISPGYSATGKLVALAIADDKTCRIIEFVVSSPARHDTSRSRSNARAPPRRNTAGLQLLQDQVLCRSVGDIFAFDMAPLSMSLYCDSALRIINAIDIQSGFSAVDRKPLLAIKEVIGNNVPIMEKNIVETFRNPVYKRDERNHSNDLAMRAWVSQFLPGISNGAEIFEKVKKIDTLKLPAQMLDMIAKIANDSLRLDQLKPTQTKHEFTKTTDAAGQAVIRSVNYKNKLRSGQNIRATIQGTGAGEYAIRGEMAIVEGKSGVLTTNHLLGNKTMPTIISIGRDDPTTAEAQRAATVCCILQGTDKLLSDSPWIKNIWLPGDGGESLIWPEDWSLPSPTVFQVTTRHQSPPPPPSGLVLQLNASQQQAVNTMFSPLDSDRITIIQGPPGTGKTSVIASFVQLAIQAGFDGLWLVAQSNVAVKNIAEKLAKVGFLNWKLLVSNDFHYEWHEHIYTKLSEDNVIRSDRFMKLSPHALKGCKVMLCTLSMLSNRFIGKFTSQNPIKTLIVDEASQIEIGNYVTVFSHHHTKLRKACFIGDDKQLPPFGQEDLQDLQSIFEVPHLRHHALFLDTQYRMPPQIGEKISAAVYDGNLKSFDGHPITDEIIACRFIDVAGHEKVDGVSFSNTLECDAVLKLAQQLQDQQKEYQIITPYEGQRGLIETRMKNTPGLSWENKCFNVDSFQGNEQDYIVISLVRSRECGFLTNLRRTNVMLTRCKKGMFIISSRKFITGVGAPTLVGTLAEQVGSEAWLDIKDVEEGKF